MDPALILSALRTFHDETRGHPRTHLRDQILEQVEAAIRCVENRGFYQAGIHLDWVTGYCWNEIQPLLDAVSCHEAAAYDDAVDLQALAQGTGTAVTL